jgi:D-serine deaminase-like pyridoxal phosphate-dependent protein
MQALGVGVLINCKSGLDRTGLQTAAQSAVSSLWALYPRQRWGLHLAAINAHVLHVSRRPNTLIHYI